MNQQPSERPLAITATEGHELVEQGKLIGKKIDLLLNLVSEPHPEEKVTTDDPVNLMIGLLTEMVRGQQAQQQWIEAISEKLDSLIEVSADDTR